jgi:hypothetical protein
MQLSGHADFLRHFWSHESGLMQFCGGSDKGTASHFVPLSETLQQRPQQRLDKRSGKKA